MRKFLIGFILSVLFIPGLVSATDWYVRPAGGSYGSEDGSSYANAWDGLGNVVWGSGGVDAGDTLYVCGLHLRNRTGGSKWEQIKVNVSGTEDNRVTIRGDCPGDPGIIWGAGIISYDTWTNESGGVYSITIGGNYDGSSFFFEDITANNWTVLKKADNLTDCQNTPGSQYSSNYQHLSTLYVHTSDGLDPTGRIAGNRDGYNIAIDDTSYITWQDLETYSIYRWLDYTDSPPGWITYHIFDNVTFWYASAGIMLMRQGSHHNIWQNCNVAWAKNGIGGAASPRGNGSLSPHDVIISNCTFHDIGVYLGDSDAHAIAWQGGYNNTFENNEMNNVGSGITIYGYPDQGFWNYTIRWNYIHGTHLNGGANGRGIELNNDANGVYTGNKVYGNIVTDCNDTAYRTKTTDMSYFYNNVAKNCKYGIYLLGSAGTSLKATLRNNIFYNVTYNIWWSTGAMNPGEYVLDSDYNLFYPETGEKFRFADDVTSDTYDFAEWQALSKPNCTFDPNSLTVDPLFADPENGDFRLQADSPAIDNGTDVGLTLDYEGNSIPQGNGTDIGAYEYQSGAAYPSGDLDYDGDVDIFDLQIVTGNFGLTSGYDPRADTIQTGEIDIFDAVFVASRFTM